MKFYTKLDEVAKKLYNFLNCQLIKFITNYGGKKLPFWLLSTSNNQEFVTLPPPTACFGGLKQGLWIGQCFLDTKMKGGEGDGGRGGGSGLNHLKVWPLYCV